jgi:putative transposase
VSREVAGPSRASVVARRLTSEDVLETLSRLIVRRGAPDHIRSDNGPDFTTKRVRDWLASLEVCTHFIEPVAPWEYGFIERLNGSLRDKSLNCETIDTMPKAQVSIENWRRKYIEIRQHSSLGYLPPAPEGRLPCSAQLIRQWRRAIRNCRYQCWNCSVCTELAAYLGQFEPLWCRVPPINPTGPQNFARYVRRRESPVLEFQTAATLFLLSTLTFRGPIQ